METNLVLIGTVCFVCVCVFVCCVVVLYTNSFARPQNQNHTTYTENFVPIPGFRDPRLPFHLPLPFPLPFPFVKRPPAIVPAASPVPPRAEQPRVIVSMSTLPQRTEHIAQTLKSLAMQTLKPHAVLICVPRRADRFGLDYDLAGLAATAGTHGAKLVLAEKDYGPATKIVPVLAVCRPTDVLVYLDDDGWYGAQLLERLVQQLLDGSWLAHKRVVSNSVGNVYCKPGSHDTIPEGAFGVCLSAHAVTYADLRTAMTTVPKECTSCDDYTLGEFFAAKGVRVERLRDRVGVKQLEYGFQSDALHAEKNTPQTLQYMRYGACARALPGSRINVYGGRG